MSGQQLVGIAIKIKCQHCQQETDALITIPQIVMLYKQYRRLRRQGKVVAA